MKLSRSKLKQKGEPETQHATTLNRTKLAVPRLAGAAQSASKQYRYVFKNGALIKRPVRPQPAVEPPEQHRKIVVVRALLTRGKACANAVEAGTSAQQAIHTPAISSGAPASVRGPRRARDVALRLDAEHWGSREVAHYLGCSRATLHRWRNRDENRFPMPTTPGRRCLWEAEVVREWFRGCQKKPD